MLIPRALSSGKAVYENNGQLLPSTAVLDIIPNAISGIISMDVICRGRDRGAYTIIGYQAATAVSVKCFVDSFLYSGVARWRKTQNWNLPNGNRGPHDHAITEFRHLGTPKLILPRTPILSPNMKHPARYHAT
ncbi:hypothetical protein PVK06_039387 [Gossypium arboreum]|uniref:Uncharacterized protein n=1 Tax=Gossypium arboreum TaxID=29729 RepID=A0ABR0N2Q9_GOSAR|nr:hypothetical protein PVK06_039387 [Gossypium arboreum]